MKQIFLIRHTTPDVNKGICYGQTDLPVAHSFEEEWLTVQQVLPDLTDIQVYSSPLQRCKQLAATLTQKQADNLSLVFDDRLKEMYFGDWEMKAWQDISPESLQTWMRNFVEIPTPNGESHQQVHRRSMSFWEEKLALPHETYCIVSHYGVMQSLLASLLHIPLDKLFRIDMGFGAVVRITLGEEGYCKVKFLK